MRWPSGNETCRTPRAVVRIALALYATSGWLTPLNWKAAPARPGGRRRVTRQRARGRPRQRAPAPDTSQRARPRQARAWAGELEGADGRVVRDLLQEDAGAIGQVRLPGLAQDGVERLAPRLEHVLQARHKPAAVPGAPA
jgi:hypothetical protein